MRPDTVLWRSAEGIAYTAPDSALNPQAPGFVDIIDQTLLPGEFRRILLSDPQSVYEAIRRLAVRGAPAIGCAAALGLAACAQRFSVPDREEFLACLYQTAAYLESSRPTAVNLSWALRRCCAKTSECAGGVSELLAVLLNEALAILAEDIAMCDAIGQNGLALLEDGMGVLTHCNAGALATGGCGTALAPVYAAQKAGLRLHVYSDETRPLLQGARLTAWELSQSGVDVTTICDSMAAVIDRSGNVLGRFDFDRKLISCVNAHGTSGMALVFDRYTEARATDVTFIGSRGEQVKTVSVSGKFLCANGNSSHAAVYCDGTATVFDYSGNKTAELTSEQELLASLGFINPDSYGLIDNTQEITRIDFASTVGKIININPTVAASFSYYDDVAADSWYAGYMEKAYQMGIINGDGMYSL